MLPGQAHNDRHKMTGCPKRRTRKIAWGFVLLLALSGTGCNEIQNPTAPSPNDSKPAVAAASNSKQLSAQVFVYDPSLRPALARPITGDMRPIYVFSGRIRNISSQNLSRVTMRLGIFASGVEVDQTDVNIVRSIPPNGISSFSEQVHILPPKGKWNWSALVIDAHGD